MLASPPKSPRHTGSIPVRPNDDEQFLLRAFRSFAEAAASLEQSYGGLRSEVERLRLELQESNAGLSRSLEENRRMRRQLDHILGGLPCGVLAITSRGEIVLANPESRRLLGSAGVVGGKVYEAWHASGESATPLPASTRTSVAELPEDFRELLDSARSAPPGSEESERRVPDDTGGWRWLSARHASIPDGETHLSIFIVRDRSDAHRLDEERGKLRRQQALADMSAILAHEIRNPLGSLELFAGLLAEVELSAECRCWVAHLQAGLRTLAATVNNVLHFHSLPAPERVPTDLGGLLEWAAGFLAPVARQARVELVLRNRLQGVTLAADRHQLEQVLLNLVLNALRAMPGGGWVQISGRRLRGSPDEGVEISVADSGPGIAPEHLAQIFEPGFSTHPSSAGLGLAVCRRIVEQHEGKIKVGGRYGAGAVFTLTLPLLQEIDKPGAAQ